MFLFQIETDGDAFADGCALIEISKMLHRCANSINGGLDTVNIVGTLRDTNGNTCGAFRYIPANNAGTCSHCNGAGIVGRQYGGDGFAVCDFENDCDECDGTGRADKRPPHYTEPVPERE